jgi:hypothetical protein
MSDKGNSIGDRLPIGPLRSVEINTHAGVSPANWETQIGGKKNPGGYLPERVGDKKRRLNGVNGSSK